MPSLHQQFGHIDIYLFDQLLRGNITPGMRILDAGCGGGRNLVYLLHEGYEIFAADVVLLSAVLHFARDDAHFTAMLTGAWRTLKPGGLFFCRLASTIGMQHQRLSGRRFLSPDGVERYLVDESLLLELTAKLGAHLVDPIKTTVVQNQRCMTTWVLRKIADQ
jgi:tellurite methyltransferase